MVKMDAIEHMAQRYAKTGSDAWKHDRTSLREVMEQWDGVSMRDIANGKLRNEVDKLITAVDGIYANEQHSALMEYISKYKNRQSTNDPAAEALYKYYRDEGFDKVKGELAWY